MRVEAPGKTTDTSLATDPLGHPGGRAPPDAVAAARVDRAKRPQAQGRAHAAVDVRDVDVGVAADEADAEADVLPRGG